MKRTEVEAVWVDENVEKSGRSDYESMSRVAQQRYDGLNIREIWVAHITLSPDVDYRVSSQDLDWARGFVVYEMMKCAGSWSALESIPSEEQEAEIQRRLENEWVCVTHVMDHTAVKETVKSIRAKYAQNSNINRVVFKVRKSRETWERVQGA